LGGREGAEAYHEKRNNPSEVSSLGVPRERKVERWDGKFKGVHRERKVSLLRPQRRNSIYNRVGDCFQKGAMLGIDRTRRSQGFQRPSPSANRPPRKNDDRVSREDVAFLKNWGPSNRVPGLIGKILQERPAAQPHRKTT